MCSFWRRRESHHTNMTWYRSWRNMYHQRRFEKWGLNCRYHNRRWNCISVRVQYDAMRRVKSIYLTCYYIHIMNLRFIVWIQLPEFFFRIFASFNVNIVIHRWTVIRGVRTSPTLDTSASTINKATENIKATMNAKSSSTITSCFYCVGLKCLIIWILFTCSSYHIFELAKISTEQIVYFTKKYVWEMVRLPTHFWHQYGIWL